MSFISQLEKLIDGAGFSDQVKNKMKKSLNRVKLRKKDGHKGRDCLFPKEKEELKNLIKTDILLDAVEIQIYKTYLEEIDKLLIDLNK